MCHLSEAICTRRTNVVCIVGRGFRDNHTYKLLSPGCGQVRGSRDGVDRVGLLAAGRRAVVPGCRIGVGERWPGRPAGEAR